MKDYAMYMHNRVILENAYLTISNPGECKMGGKNLEGIIGSHGEHLMMYDT